MGDQQLRTKSLWIGLFLWSASVSYAFRFSTTLGTTVFHKEDYWNGRIVRSATSLVRALVKQ